MLKLTVLNNALGNTGNRLLNVLNDGTDEWITANRGFDEAVQDLVTRRNWPFATATADLTPAAAAANPSNRFDYAYELPAAVLHVREILYSTSTLDPVGLDEYEIIGRYLATNYSSGIRVVYISMPADAVWHPQAEKILTLYVEAACLNGLNEDFVEARARKAEAESRLMEAGPRNTSQNPSQNAYRSSVSDARRSRMGG